MATVVMRITVLDKDMDSPSGSLFLVFAPISDFSLVGSFSLSSVLLDYHTQLLLPPPLTPFPVLCFILIHHNYQYLMVLNVFIPLFILSLPLECKFQEGKKFVTFIPVNKNCALHIVCLTNTSAFIHEYMLVWLYKYIHTTYFH